MDFTKFLTAICAAKS